MTHVNHNNTIEKFLKVSLNHEIYYEVFGNPNGIPILFVHGGPGVGFSENDKRFFDPKKFKIILFDQRGASRSKPFGQIENNSTDLLIDDINLLLKEIDVTKTYLFGGSWGSTLALAFAIKNPDKVFGLLLRGIFLGNDESIKHFINGGVKLIYPKEWFRFQKLVPKKEKKEISKYYLSKMLSNDPKIADKYAYEWAYYEISIFKKNIKPQEISKILDTIPFKSLAILEAHYLTNNCFLDHDYILNNAHILNNIPTTIIQGRFDVICPPIFAYQLHKKMINSKLKFVDAGHSDSEPEIEKELKKELKNIIKNHS